MQNLIIKILPITRQKKILMSALQLKPQSSEALKLESLINKLPKKLKILENLKFPEKKIIS